MWQRAAKALLQADRKGAVQFFTYKVWGKAVSNLLHSCGKGQMKSTEAKNRKRLATEPSTLGSWINARLTADNNKGNNYSYHSWEGMFNSMGSP